MYINKEKLKKANVVPEKGGFVAYVDLGKDAYGKRLRPKGHGKTVDPIIHSFNNPPKFLCG